MGQGRLGNIFSNRSATASIPSLLKPRRLIKAREWGKRNNLGFMLPDCANGVIVPTSTKPKPTRARGKINFAFLSKPAAIPNGETRLCSQSLYFLFTFCGGEKGK